MTLLDESRWNDLFFTDGAWGPGSGQISLEVPMSRKALDELAKLLQSHLVRNGRTAAVDAARAAGATDAATQTRNRSPVA